MNAELLEKMAKTAFDNLSTARQKLYAAAERTIEARAALENDKGQAVVSGKFDGKNAEIREAQSLDYLRVQYAELAAAEREERRARFEFDRADIDADTVKIMLRIAELGGK